MCTSDKTTFGCVDSTTFDYNNYINAGTCMVNAKDYYDDSEDYMPFCANEYECDSNDCTMTKFNFVPLYPTLISRNGDATIVFWSDGTKTVVKLCKEDKVSNADSEYTAFCIALAKKVYGSNSALHRMIDEVDEEKIAIREAMEHAKKQAEEEERQRINHEKKIRRMAKEIRMLNEATTLAEAHVMAETTARGQINGDSSKTAATSDYVKKSEKKEEPKQYKEKTVNVKDAREEMREVYPFLGYHDLDKLIHDIYRQLTGDDDGDEDE